MLEAERLALAEKFCALYAGRVESVLPWGFRVRMLPHRDCANRAHDFKFPRPEDELGEHLWFAAHVARIVFPDSSRSWRRAMIANLLSIQPASGDAWEDVAAFVLETVTAPAEANGKGATGG